MSMSDDLKAIEAQFQEGLAAAETMEALEALRVSYLGKKGQLTAIMRSMGQVPPEERPAMGQLANTVRANVDAALKDKILVIGENLKIRRFVRYEGVCAAYVHGGGTHGVIVKFETSDEVASKPEFAAFGKDIAMQVAAANPTYLNREAVPADVLAKEKEIVLAQMANDPKTANKPDAIKEKMAIGKLGKFYKEACLMDQAYIKDGGIDVTKYVADTAKALGGDIKVVEYTHYVKGEGLEKRNEDFAAEVAAAIKH